MAAMSNSTQKKPSTLILPSTMLVRTRSPNRRSPRDTNVRIVRRCSVIAPPCAHTVLLTMERCHTSAKSVVAVSSGRPNWTNIRQTGTERIPRTKFWNGTNVTNVTDTSCAIRIDSAMNRLFTTSNHPPNCQPFGKDVRVISLAPSANESSLR